MMDAVLQSSTEDADVGLEREKSQRRSGTVVQNFPPRMPDQHPQLLNTIIGPFSPSSRTFLEDGSATYYPTILPESFERSLNDAERTLSLDKSKRPPPTFSGSLETNYPKPNETLSIDGVSPTTHSKATLPPGIGPQKILPVSRRPVPPPQSLSLTAVRKPNMGDQLAQLPQPQPNRNRAAEKVVHDLINRFRVETKFQHNQCDHITYYMDPKRGRKMQSRRQTWRREKTIGFGGFGEVWLEKDADSEPRAVKIIRKRGPLNYVRELHAHVLFSSVRQ